MAVARPNSRRDHLDPARERIDLSAGPVYVVRSTRVRASRGQLSAARRAWPIKCGGMSGVSMTGNPHGSIHMHSGRSSAHTP